MSFLDKVKTMFNIGGIEVIFDHDTAVEKHKGEMKGKITLEAKGDRKVRKVNIRLDQHIKKVRNGNESVEIVTIGSIDYDLNLTMKAGESKVVDFVVSFDPKKDFGDKIAEKMGDMGGVLGMVGAIGATMHNMEKTYTLKVKLDIEGALWKPEESNGVKLI